jgi:hypothetical protein
VVLKQRQLRSAGLFGALLVPGEPCKSGNVELSRRSGDAPWAISARGLRRVSGVRAARPLRRAQDCQRRRPARSDAGPDRRPAAPSAAVMLRALSWRWFLPIWRVPMRSPSASALPLTYWAQEVPQLTVGATAGLARAFARETGQMRGWGVVEPSRFVDPPPAFVSPQCLLLPHAARPEAARCPSRAAARAILRAC